MMSPFPAPIAFRMPISRVRSVTVTSMMFMTPIPPTSNEMAATAPSRTVKVSFDEVTADSSRRGAEHGVVAVSRGRWWRPSRMASDLCLRGRRWSTTTWP